MFPDRLSMIEMEDVLQRHDGFVTGLRAVLICIALCLLKFRFYLTADAIVEARMPWLPSSRCSRRSLPLHRLLDDRQVDERRHHAEEDRGPPHELV